MQVPLAVHDTASRYPYWRVPVPAPAGSGAWAAAQVVPEPVTIRPNVRPVEFSNVPTAVQAPLAVHEIEARYVS